MDSSVKSPSVGPASGADGDGDVLAEILEVVVVVEVGITSVLKEIYGTSDGECMFSAPPVNVELPAAELVTTVPPPVVISCSTI
jgi:hypothetical protein